MKTILSRVAFCEKCFSRGSPKYEEMFLVYGTHSKDFHIYKVEFKGERGYTPHILVLNKVIHKEMPEVIYESCCGICGVTFSEDKNGLLYYKTKDFERKIIDLNSWNAWCLYKDEDYFI